MKIKFRINLIARVSPHARSLIFRSGSGERPSGSELEESTPWPSKNPGENTAWGGGNLNVALEGWGI